MRFTFGLLVAALAIVPFSVLSAPVRLPLHPALASRDPMKLHKRATVPPPLADDADADVDADPEAETADLVEEACTAVCGTVRVEGAQTEREALCSVEGLRATLECATCIDSAWPDTTWEDSATAEYERIFSACHEGPQTLFGTTKKPIV